MNSERQFQIHAVGVDFNENFFSGTLAGFKKLGPEGFEAIIDDGELFDRYVDFTVAGVKGKAVTATILGTEQAEQAHGLVVQMLEGLK